MANIKPLSERIENNQLVSEELEFLWKNIIEDNLDIELKSYNITKTIIDDSMAFEHRYSFYGLLNALGVSSKYHWIILRINGMYDPCEFDERFKMIYIPDESNIKSLLQLFNTQKKISTV